MDILDAIKTRKRERQYFIRDDGDDRWYCHECLNLMDGLCLAQKFHPVDDIPRRCEDFKK